MADEAPTIPNWRALRGVPVSILTGFLGAGKTTLLNRLIGDPWLSDAALTDACAAPCVASWSIRWPI